MDSEVVCMKCPNLISSRKNWKIFVNCKFSCCLTPSTLGKIFSRWHFEIFFLFFPENRIWHFMQTVSKWRQFAWNVKSCFWGKKRRKISIWSHDSGGGGGLGGELWGGGSVCWLVHRYFCFQTWANVNEFLLGMCIDIVVIWFGIATGQILSVFERLNCPWHENGGMLLFHVFISPWKPMSCNYRKCTFSCLARTVKIQLSLHIFAVWSEISLGTFWLAEDVKFP